MKSAKAATVDASSHRRSQPARQARTNPPRTTANAARNAARDSAGQNGDQSIDIFPAVTHFADAMVSLPKDLVRHFTLLKEVDAKLCTPEEQLFQLVNAAVNAPPPETRPNNETSSSIAPASAPMSAQNSSTGAPPNAPSADESIAAASVFEPSNYPRRQLFRQTAYKIQEMLVSLEEKNHVLSTANDALQRQLARIEDVWPHLESEYSDEAKWGSTTHWAYPENRSGKHPERARRDGAAAISAAAQALADEAAARSDARKQALQAKKGMRNNHNDTELDNHDAPRTGKGHGKGRKAADSHVGLGISGTDPPPKKRKVEKVTNGGVAMERSMSSAMSYAASKAKGGSPTPAPEGPKKRKALPSGSGQSKKKTAMSPSVTSSPVVSALPEPKSQARASPAPNTAPRPTTARARQNSLQSAARPPALNATKSNGTLPGTPEVTNATPVQRSGSEARPTKEPSAPARGDAGRREAERTESISTSTPVPGKKEPKIEESERKSESITPAPAPATVTTKSGRASKPSTPALATFQEASRSRSSRNVESAGNKKNGKKGGAAAVQAPAPPPLDDDAASADGDIDAEEPTYCYCNSVSYGEMVACDADECEREWFHLACVGLKVAPAEKSKWYCEDCKQRLHIGGKKANGR